MHPTSPKHLLRRVVAIAVAAAMVASCSGSSDEDAVDTPTTVAPSPENSSTAELVAAAIGDGVDTQDFQLLVDMAVVDESGDATSFFGDVLSQADEGRRDPVDLGDGLVYVPTDSIEGAIVDAEGGVVPGASIGIGLLEVADGDEGIASLPSAWIGDATGDELEESRALVIFSTTRRADGATHIGFGDQFELDITFVENVVPGDTVRQTTVSGQALRLAGEDATADDHSVFANRLAERSAGMVTVVDDGVVIPEFEVTESVAIEGSTKTQKAIKAGLGGLVLGAGALTVGLVCLETVGLGCAAGIVLLGPRLKFVGDQIRKGNDPSCPGTRLPGPVGAGGGRDTSPGGGGGGFMVQGVAYTEPSSADPPPVEFVGPVGVGVLASFARVALVAEGDGDGGGGAGGGAGGAPGGGGAGGSCPSPSAGGDVHMRTIDGRAYDLQSVGEFVAARSSGGHEIQLRTAPLGNSRRVSVGAAVAADVAGTAVSIQQDADGVDVHIDGEAVDIGRGDFVAVGDRGALVSTGEALMVVWPDGSQLNVFLRGGFIDIRFFPVENDSLSWEGLFGDRDGDNSNDLRLADGVVLDAPTVDDIHGQFADSWRVSDDSSLFHYDEGESTETYTDRSFPDALTTNSDLDPDLLAAARETCSAYGIVDEAALADCAYDLAITGELVFLRSAGMLQDSTYDGSDASVGSVAFEVEVSAESTVQDQAINGEIAEPGDVVRHEFEATAGDRVWVSVDAVNGDCLNDEDEHLGWELISPEGVRVDSLGDLRSCPERGPIALESGGTWTLAVSAGANDPSTGTYELRLRGVGADDAAEVSVGDTVEGEIESVGVSDFYRFEASAGDRVWVSVDAVNGDCASGEDEHLGWELISPEGVRVDSLGDLRSCPERGPIALESGGTWTLAVSAGANDPSTGTYELRLIDVPDDDEAETSIGATVQGDIESVGVADFHRFEASAGDRVWVSVDAVNGDCLNDEEEHLGWELISPEGTTVDSLGDLRSCPERGPIALESGGTWTLAVSAGANDPSTGTYELRLIDVPDDDEAETSIGATVQGDIESVGVADFHRFDAKAGDAVQIVVDAVNGDCSSGEDEHLGWELISPEGVRVDSLGDLRSCPEQAPIALETAGTWMLVVSAGANDPSTGTYELRLLDAGS